MSRENQVEQQEKVDWLPAQPLVVTLATFGLALLWERLIYGRPLGVAFPIWLALALALGLAWSRLERRTVSIWGYLLPAPILGLALLVPWRVEPLTTFLAGFLAILLSLMWVRLLRPGGLFAWGWLDYLAAPVLPTIEGWLRPWPTLVEAQAVLTRGESWSRRLLAVLRGLLLALPVAILFLALLSAADLVFGQWVNEALDWLNLERLFDFLTRTFVVLMLTVFLVGLLVTALRRSRQAKLVRGGEPLLKPFLGMTEASMVLTSVDAIFAVFVFVQFRYFFGGEANISAAGYTYAEYARRGFGELVAVSFLTLGLILLLANWSRRKARSDRVLFRSLSGLAVAMTGVMLVSAMVRLQLYERAFGFTRLRTYTHVFIVLLALLFLSFLLLLFLGRLRQFANICLLAGIAFTFSLAGLNVDAFIVERNYQHLQEIGKLDAWYLTTLSDDAIPAIVVHLEMTPPEQQPVLLAGLSCRRYLLEQRAQTTSWPSYRWPHQRARMALARIDERLDNYPVQEYENYAQVEYKDEEYFYCYSWDFIR